MEKEREFFFFFPKLWAWQVRHTPVVTHPRYTGSRNGTQWVLKSENTKMEGGWEELEDDMVKMHCTESSKN